MKKIYSIGFFLLLASGVVAQQDVQNSQYMFNQLALNPAYAGSRDAINTGMLSRDQWTQMPGAPQTFLLYAHGPLKSKKIGLGFQASNDKIGPKSVFGLSGDFAYRINLTNSSKIALGLRYGMYRYSFDWSVMEYKDLNDPYNTMEQTHKMVPSADFGVYFNSLKYYAGISATHLFGDKSFTEGVENPTGTIAELKPHIFTNGGAAFILMDNLVANPSFLVKFVESAPASIDVNLNFLIDEKIWLGTSYRVAYGMAFLAQYQITPKFKVGYSYDFGFNRIGRVGGASHELMIGYDFRISKSAVISPRYL